MSSRCGADQAHPHSILARAALQTREQVVAYRRWPQAALVQAAGAEPAAGR